MADPITEQLWTGFNNRKLAAERAKKDWNGRELSSIVGANNSTVTIKSGSNSTADGSFTLNQNTDATVTLATATTTTDGVMSSTDKAKLDGISPEANKVTGDPDHYGSILVDGNQVVVYVHPTDGPAGGASVGDTTAQTPGFGGTFKVTSETVNAAGHTTAVAEHTVTIPSNTATTSADGLMSSSDKTKLEGIEAGAQVNVKPDWNAASGSAAEILNKPEIPTVNDTTITIAYGASSDSFTTNAATAKTITIPNAASASGGTAATGGLMTATDKENLDNATAVIPPEATAQNQLVDKAAMEAAIADLGGYKVVPGDSTTHEPILPSGESASTKIVYLVKVNDATLEDKYYEWICTNVTGPVWELIGETSINLEGYAQNPDNKVATHIVTFGSNDVLVDSGKTVAELENVVTTVSVGNGSTISPTTGTTNINIPLASSSADGAMSSADKAKLDGITDYLVSAAYANNTLTITPKTGSAVTVDVPSASASTDVPVMDGTAAVGTSTAYARADHVHPSDTAKADKVSPSAPGNLAALDSTGNLIDSGVIASGFKTIQTAVVDPTASGNAVSFIDTIAQDTNGEITVSKKTVPTVSKSTLSVGGTDGLMTAQQAEALYDLNTWTYATFDDQGSGAESSDVFPRNA